ncbi:MAG: response regulator transcription factor [Pedobacter sp.]|nr:MAG: response regulator transcription factor [Pedobacter sp.]
MKKRIILFDDDEARRDSLSLLLSMCADLTCVGIFETAEHAVQHVEVCKPDLVLMDLDMPIVNGIQGTKAIKEKFPKIPIIVQTIFDDEPNIFEAIKAGANGYILKSTSPEKFLNMLRDALDGGAPMSGVIAGKVLAYFKNQNNLIDYKLSEREKGILKLLVDGHSYKMIATKSNISYYTVCNHIKNIYDKLHVKSATEAVGLALKNGIV